jgi:hypothetical protein
MQVTTSQFARWGVRVLSGLLGVLSWCAASSQTPEPSPPGPPPAADRPHLDPFPAEQDWSFLADPRQRTDTYDRLKYMPWGNDAQHYASLGFEYRTEYEYFDNWMFGAGPQDHNGYVMIRVMPHVDLHSGPDLRFFTELEFDYILDRNGGPRPDIDEDRGDFHQGFLEVGSHVSHEHGTSLRLGRQEVVFGTGRLFDNNEGPNVKLSFDGGRLITQTERFRWDNFVVKPVINNVGFFDDVPKHGQTAWGSYLTAPLPIIRQGQIDLYYLGLATAPATYNRGTANEVRHTIGTRFFRAPDKGPDYNWELNYQLGSFGVDRVRAWSISTETGYTFSHTRFHPRPLLRVDAYSGDRNASGNTLGTYNPYFPRGAYFTPKAVPFLGNQNLIDFHPVVQFLARQNITGEIGWNWYWRESSQDGVYAFGSGVLIDPANSNHQRFLGYQGDMELRWAPARHFVTALNIAGFQPSGFLTQFPNHRSPIYTNLGITYRF